MLFAAKRTLYEVLDKEENTMKSKPRISLAMTAAVVLGVLAPAPLLAQQAQNPGGGPSAQTSRPSGGKMFGRCDTNKDGKVTWDEYRTCHEAWFDRLDSQHQGKVTLDQVKANAPNPARAQAMFDRIDTGHTGVITREQYDKWLRARFDSLDTNHDGALTPDEMRQARAKHQGAAGGAWPGSGSQ
jgi:EF hand domain-containing protein